ncbi:MAG TPA: molybdopterin-binding protein [Blastocatellia bacterium]|nr:molybdopterin-binding protein [Blastocatellia bacterium]
MVNVEIIAIGNEILLGLVQDTNSNYLCRVVRGMGGRVCHITIVRDEIAAIAEELKASMNRRADLIFTCGGLGPTDDDLTLAAVAVALDRQLVVDTTARKLVERKYSELARAGYVASASMTDERLKMARLPEGSRAVENSVGAAPAVLLEVGRSRIVSLPGVPAELKAIVEGPLQGLLGEVFGRGSYREREVTVECNDESQLAPALRQVAAANPDVYIKSRASHFGADVTFRVMLSASATSAEKADQMIDHASADLASALTNSGIPHP